MRTIYVCAPHYTVHAVITIAKLEVNRLCTNLSTASTVILILIILDSYVGSTNMPGWQVSCQGGEYHARVVSTMPM